MKRSLFAVFLLLMPLVLATGCGQSDQDASQVTTGEVKEEVKEAAEAVSSLTQQEMDEFVEQMEGQLKNLDGKIAELESRADNLKAEAQEAVARNIEAMKKKRDEAYGKLKELKSSGADAWEELKLGLQSAMFELDRAIDAAAAEFG